ncbi:MAG: nucleotidyltransferase domain-containing protein [Bacteroidales bacterium]|nr:nucleotidyltransferase domain-containing protein [Bacteroidales bacterium]
MENFPDKIKRLRKEKGVPLRIVAAFLDIDQAILSKIENGKRNASKAIVVKLAEYYHVEERELLISWLSDKMLNEVEDSGIALEAIKVAEKKIAYRKPPYLTKEKIIEIIRDFLHKDGRVEKAWIFGSFARGDYEDESDVDLMVTYSEKATGTLLDYADIKYFLEKLIHREIDLVEEGFVKPFALKNIENDKILIYGK